MKHSIDYLSMIQSIPAHRTALIEDGQFYTAPLPGKPAASVPWPRNHPDFPWHGSGRLLCMTSWCSFWH